MLNETGLCHSHSCRLVSFKYASDQLTLLDLLEVYFRVS